MHILHVEDDPHVARAVQLNLRDLIPRVQITHFTNAEAALAWREQHPEITIDLILSDYNLDRGGGLHLMTGAHFACELSNQGSEIPFVLLSMNSWEMICQEEARADRIALAPGKHSPISAYYEKSIPNWENFIQELMQLAGGQESSMGQPISSPAKAR